ncbi:hypothetical protein [Spiroplasma cantharicola]|uniref:Cell division protein FtsA n=1 Tax=Spiroplasma cantharicola TaxID=362837 RepID=A0A0M3SJG3_9MOLU|nr:hypothetical protein [Spiroplasma cantharicola]ALD66684.1 cell division protein FtsA [Spiroplasma cantharicola]
MQNETYAVIEITKKYIKFAVGKYKQNIGLKVVFKEREKSKSNWLTEKNDIIDTNIVAHRLVKMINRYESIFKEKIRRASIVYPTGTLQIKDANPSIFIDGVDKIVREEHIKSLYKDAKRVVYEDNLVVTNIKPYEFKLNGIQSFAKPPINSKANMVSMNAKVYTAEKHVVQSFEEVLKVLRIERLSATSQLFSLAKQCSDGLNFRETFALINWDWDSIDIGYFSRETLVKKDSIKFGLKDIIENLAKKMSSKFDIANKYIFKLLDFSSNTLDNTVMYRKYISAEKRSYELKAIDIKYMLLEEINGVIDKTDLLISRELGSIKNFKIYHTGKSTEIAGFEKLLLRSNYKNISEIYYSLITGASEIWTSSLCGMMRHSHLTNKNLREVKTSTETYENPNMLALAQMQQAQQVLGQKAFQQQLRAQHAQAQVQQAQQAQLALKQQLRAQQFRTEQLRAQQGDFVQPLMKTQLMQQNNQIPQSFVDQQNYQNNENYLKNGIINTQRNKY